MKLSKTKLAGIISLLCCTSTMAAVDVSVVATQTDESRFGPFVSAASADASQIATYTQTFAQSFAYDIGAPWTYNEYCLYDSDVCSMLWKGTKSDLSDSLIAWRSNIMSTYDATSFKSELASKVGNSDVTGPGLFTLSTKVTAVNSAGDKVGYATSSTDNDGHRITRRGFYNNNELSPSFVEKGGFSSAHDFADVQVTNSDGTIAYNKTLAVGQASVAWARNEVRFDRCFDSLISDDPGDYDELYYCPGFDLQASYWEVSDAGNPTATSFVDGWIDSGNSASYLANAYAINTSGFAAGFTTDQIFDADSGGRARAVLFAPTVKSEDSKTILEYERVDISKPLTDAGEKFNTIIRDTVAVDITDTKFNSAKGEFEPADGIDAKQDFIVVGNRTFNVNKNGNYATEFFTYNVADGSVRYPLTDIPIKGANSRVTKINNDGIAVGWRDSRGEVNRTYRGSPRFQSAFLYDFKKNKSVYLDEMYCRSSKNDPNKKWIRMTNAISVSEKDISGNYTILANGYDYETEEKYKNKTGSSPVVVKMTFTDQDIIDDTNDPKACPSAESEPYKRQGAGMGWLLILPLTILFRRRFNG